MIATRPLCPNATLSTPCFTVALASTFRPSRTTRTWCWSLPASNESPLGKRIETDEIGLRLPEPTATVIFGVPAPDLA